MKKDAFWFHHDSNARTDDKIVRLRRLTGLEGVGLYWCVIECLREANAYQLPEHAISDICYDLRCEKSVFDSLFECKLLELVNGCFYSESLLRRMKKYDQVCKKRSNAGKLGGQAKAKQMLSKSKAKGVAKSSDLNRIERNRIEENRDSNALVAGEHKCSPATKKEPTIGSVVWNRYAEAYEYKYKTLPVRNAKTNSLCSQLAKRLGSVAPDVASYFLSLNNQYYVARGHQLAILVSDAEKVHTEWMTGNNVTQTSAREADRLQSAGDAWARVIEKHGDK